MVGKLLFVAGRFGFLPVLRGLMQAVVRLPEAAVELKRPDFQVESQRPDIFGLPVWHDLRLIESPLFLFKLRELVRILPEEWRVLLWNFPAGVQDLSAGL